ncbi:hypothetical protein J2TS6_13960 [Paenibacillus albilobatus]|uniref:Uncharacterized protein n=1 Tax=Paenibacillus albilobatus TaxID=2716884 RepID=A0A919XFY8_9BACL|nr:hypothetical protein J2TS6_13960 [Paenibacillus albilobatus]
MQKIPRGRIGSVVETQKTGAQMFHELPVFACFGVPSPEKPGIWAVIS